MTKVVNIHEAKTHFSELLEDVGRGQAIIIARRGRPIARLVPFEEPRPGDRFGWAKGDVLLGEDFDEPIDDLFDALNNEGEGEGE